MSHYYRGPSIDHSLLSPSGRMSKRARASAMERETSRLFYGVDLNPPVPQPTKAVILLRSAANLRDLAARGMSPRKFIKAAERLEAEANRPD